MNDAEFLAEAKKGNLDIGPVAGEDLEEKEKGSNLLLRVVGIC